MKHESNEEPVSNADEQEPRQEKKAWVTPVVSESPVNELTAASPTFTAVSDGAAYS